MPNQDPTSLEFAKLEVGQAMSTLVVPLTASVIVAGAIASRDFMPVHHDKDYAQAQGAPDVFMNILTTNGYVSRFVTDWAGRESMIERIAIRLGVPALPGTNMTFSGEITALEREADLGRIEVAIKGTTNIGDHVTGTVVLNVPT